MGKDRAAGRVGSGQTFGQQSRVGSGQRYAGSGPKKVTRGQLCHVIVTDGKLPTSQRIETGLNRDLVRALFLQITGSVTDLSHTLTSNSFVVVQGLTVNYNNICVLGRVNEVVSGKN